MKRIIFSVSAFLVIGFSLPVTSSPDFAERYVAGHLIVTFRPEYRGLINVENQDGIALTGITTVDKLNKLFQTNGIDKLYRNPNPNENAKRFNIDLIYLLTFPEETKMADLVNAYRTCPVIQSANPNYVYTADYVPNDSLYSDQWHHQNLQCERAWDISQGDTNVWIAIVDLGAEWSHEDLIDNIWINHEEDINHNGTFDFGPPPGGDENGVDEDANGYVDDVVGWDFYAWDNNPTPDFPDETHGTLCLGAACAVADNIRGVAGIGFGARAAGLRTGLLNSCLTQAILYAADNGAFAISMSWGSSGYSSEHDNALQYAWSMGCVLMASAGNTYSGGAVRYPGGYDHVIATAASDRLDRRSIWSSQEQSNYGTWIDVVAPGTDVYTTTIGNRYDRTFGGTSAASPCVGGLAVLLKSAFPSMTNAECTTRIFQSCDSMPDSTYRLGLLGHGRINVGKAIHQPIRCFLQMTDYRIVDRGGNNNSYPDLGETCAVVITLANDPYWQTATGVTVTANSLDTSVTFVHPTATFPDIPGGTARSCSADSILFVTHSNAIPHKLRMNLTKNANPASYDLDELIVTPVGKPRVILVDDDDGINVEQWYKQACDSIGVLYKYWNVASSGSPSLDTLNNYPVVVWFTGLDSTQTLTASDITTLSSYLDAGHNLFVCGQNLGQDIGGQAFYANYLHAAYLFNHSTQAGQRVVGIDGDPIGNSSADTLILIGTGGANNAKSLDGIKPINGAIGSHHYRSLADTIYAGIHYASNYKVVYFGFPFEAIDAGARYTQKWDILARILGFFGEPIPGPGTKEVTKTSYNPMLTLPLSITPNPFRNQTTIRWLMSNFKDSRLTIYDASGKIVRSFNITQNVTSINWNGEDFQNRTLPAGVYFCEIRNNNVNQSGKVLLLK